VPTDAERDPVEWAQHTALVAISVARTVLDLAEAAVTDRERLERLATTGRSFAEAWLGDAARVASTVVSGLGFETDAKTPASPSAGPPTEQPAAQAASKSTAARAAGSTVPKRPAKRAQPAPAKVGSKKATKAGGKKASKAGASGAAGRTARKATPARPKKRR
jgi:hypothetical protein